MRVEAAPAGTPKQVTIVEFTDTGERKGVVTVPMIHKIRGRVEEAIVSPFF